MSTPCVLFSTSLDLRAVETCYSHNLTRDKDQGGVSNDKPFALGAQQAVNELFEEKRIYLKLTVIGVEALGEALGNDFTNYYKIRFSDNFLPQITVFFKPGESLKRVVREAVEREIRGEA